ncbi:hypothetical protein HPP92_020605 [Vanilla planifolia]|uniref:LysM domain-containing protein n=1 Tax=Vanilla planifolia TaxID=51239 RepID=A0A835UGE9_VANPL|nr:hypothetical protein HPP92_020990 [Vanilla planifolia]KAG0462129.1 hypothetical protein HPP92_020605 [Vanilla planifolia]
MANRNRRPHSSAAAIRMVDLFLSLLAVGAAAMLLVGSIPADPRTPEAEAVSSRRPCDELYIVGEGETLLSIIDKCGDSFVLEDNPHVHDYDDIFPGQVLGMARSDPK